MRDWNRSTTSTASWDDEASHWVPFWYRHMNTWTHEGPQCLGGLGVGKVICLTHNQRRTRIQIYKEELFIILLGFPNRLHTLGEFCFSMFVETIKGTLYQICSMGFQLLLALVSKVFFTCQLIKAFKNMLWKIWHL